MFFILALLKLSYSLTRQPTETSLSTRWLPKKPAPPVTKADPAFILSALKDLPESWMGLAAISLSMKRLPFIPSHLISQSVVTGYFQHGFRQGLQIRGID